MTNRVEPSTPVAVNIDHEKGLLVIEDADLDRVTGAVIPLYAFAVAAGFTWGLAAGYLSNR